MARKCNLRRKIDRTLKRREGMRKREEHRRKVAESERLAKKRKEELNKD